MSRIGKQPVIVPKGVEVGVAGRSVTVKGPKGNLKWEHPAPITVKVDKDKGQVVVTRPEGSTSRQDRALHGLTRALINNMVRGVVEGYEKKLEIHGVGYDAELFDVKPAKDKAD